MVRAGVSMSGGGGGGRGGGGGGGSRRKTSSLSSSSGSVSAGTVKRLDSEILNEERRSSRQAPSCAVPPPSSPSSLLSAPPVPDSSEVCVRLGKVMESRLAWSSLWLRCHSTASKVSGAPGGENGHGRPTEAARVEAPLVRGRSLLLLAGRSLRVTGVLREEPASKI